MERKREKKQRRQWPVINGCDYIAGRGRERLKGAEVVLIREPLELLARGRDQWVQACPPWAH